MGIDVWSGVGSMFTSAMAPYQSHRDAMLRQHDAQGFDMQMFMSRYQNMVRDLEAAGLNPMLAYTQGPGAAPTSPIGQGANFDTDPVGKGVAAYNTTRIASATEANIQADTLKKTAEAKNVDVDTLVKSGIPAVQAAQIVEATNSAEQSKAMTEQIRVQIPKVEFEIQNLQTQIKNTNEDTKLKQSMESLNAYLEMLRMVEARLVNAQASGHEQENAIRDPKVRASKSWSAEMSAESKNWSWLNPLNLIPGFGKKGD